MILPLLLLLATEPPPNPDWNCDEPIAQQEMNWCAAQEFRQFDAQLEGQLNLAQAAMSARDEEPTVADDGRPSHLDRLLEAQRAWLEYRDAHCAIEGYEFRGGSMEPLMVSTCMTRLTRDRIGQLHELTADRESEG